MLISLTELKHLDALDSNFAILECKTLRKFREYPKWWIPRLLFPNLWPNGRPGIYKTNIADDMASKFKIYSGNSQGANPAFNKTQCFGKPKPRFPINLRRFLMNTPDLPFRLNCADVQGFAPLAYAWGLAPQTALAKTNSWKPI